MKKNLEGKVVLITGATDGIGKQGARELAQMGAKVVLVGRNEIKCQQTVEEITGGSVIPAEYMVADLTSMAQVKALAEGFKNRYDRLDILLNNAGGNYLLRTLTADGFEATFALNHLAYYLLTRLLLDMLIASAPSRIVNTSSGSHYRGVIHFDDIHLEKGYQVMKAYEQSKLANVIFTYSLAEKLAGTEVTANCFNPGLVATGIFRKVRYFGWLIDPVIRLKAISVEEGTQTLVFLAASEDVESATGQYYYKEKPRKTLELTYDPQAQARLLDISEEMVKKWL